MKKNLKSIVDLTSQPPLFEFERFIIRPFDGHTVWMENPDGEGTQVAKQEVLGWLIKMFDRNFN